MTKQHRSKFCRAFISSISLLLDLVGSNLVQTLLKPPKGGFPFMAETTRDHIFSKEISQVTIAAMVLAPNFY